MSGLATLALLAVMAAGVCSSDAPDCSYRSLLNHLNLINADNTMAVMRPVKNWMTTSLVYMDMVVLGILQVDEKSQTVTYHVQTQMKWKNEFLTWNSSDFCGIDILTVPRNMLWVPCVAISEDTSDSGSIKNSPMLTLSSAGWLTANGFQRLTTTCHLQLYLFPFDKQYCNITFSSLDYYDPIKLGTVNSEEVLSLVSGMLMVTQGEWQLEDISVIHYTVEIKNVSYNKLIYTVVIERKPMLYVINLIIPLFYFLVLDLGSFFIKGEKLSFKVTVLLSISVLLLILQDMLPSTENTLPLMANYCVVVFTLVGLSILEAMLIDFLLALDDYYGDKAQNAVKIQEVEIPLEGNSNKAPVHREGSPVTKPSESEVLMLILEEVKLARQETGRHVKDKRKPGYCSRLATIIDYVYFVLYAVTVVVYLTHLNMTWWGGYYADV